MRSRPLVAILASAATLLAARAAHADDDDTFTLGAGVLVIGGANFLGEPSDKSITLPSGASAEGIYPGFAGAMFGGGLAIDARLLGVIGVEIDILHSSDRGSGDINQFSVKIGQTAWHLPILLKGVIPLGMVRPFAVVGPELVFPNTSEVEITPSPGAGSTEITATADGYTMVTFGLGLELHLPLPVIDLRIPFSIRGSVNPGTSDEMADRATYSFDSPGGGVEYRSEWQYQVAGSLGVQLYF